MRPGSDEIGPRDRAAPPGRVRRVAQAKVVVVAVGLVVLTVAHVAAPPQWHEFHAMLFNIAFVPLILAGLWFHVRGAVIASVSTSVMSLAHLFLQLEPEHSMGHWSTVVLILLYNVVAFTTGVLSQRHAQALWRAEEHAHALERNTRSLIQAEEVIARSELCTLEQLACRRWGVFL